MNSISPMRLLVLVVILAVAVSSCGDDKKTNPTETSPPEVVSHDPETNDSDVSVDESIRIVFNEAMTGSSAQGNVTLNHGTITSIEWEDDRTLVIEHSPWGQGLQVTVTIGTGLADANGNRLAAPYIFSFWTESTSLQLLSSDPPNGAVDVPRNTMIELLFSNSMDLQSLDDAMTVGEANTQVSYQFELSEGNEHGTVLVVIIPTLPPETLMEVTITTDAQDTAGNHLAQASSFRFTTSGSIDTTPPEVVSVDPADGAIANPDIGFIRITFSEPMNTESIQPTSMNAELWVQMLIEEIEPSWSEGNTVVTVPLPSSLPPGLPMEINLAGFSDRNGNVQSEEYRWSASVSGTADYMPVVDGQRFYNWHLFDEGPIGSEDPTDSFEGFDYTQIDVQTDGTFFFSDYHDREFSFTDEWEVFRKTTTHLNWIGSHDEDEGVETDITFSDPLPFLVFPIEAGTHHATASVEVPGRGP